MTNEEIAESFRNRIKEFGDAIPLDYYDRAVDLAIYMNDTIPNSDDAKVAIKCIENGMYWGYFYYLEMNKQESNTKEEVNDTSQ